MKLRNSVKAWIVENGCVLVVEKQRDTLEFHLPGGKQKKRETLKQALERECVEELGAHIEVGRLLAVYERFDAVHKVEFLFMCRLLTAVSGARKPDADQVGTRWLPFSELPDTALFPAEVWLALKREKQGYLGEL